MSSHQTVHRVLDGALVRRRRGELGYTESHLGALCGVSGSIIRRLESGFHQDDLSMRFVAQLTGALGVALADLVIRPASAPAPTDTADHPTAGERLGSLLVTAGGPVPHEAACRLLGWDSATLNNAAAVLKRALEHAGLVLVDTGDTLRIAADVSSIDADTATGAVRAAFARRRPTIPELRIVARLADGTIVRREALDTPTGMAIARLRAAGILAPARAVNTGGDPPELSEDVRYSLMLDADCTSGT